MGKYNTTDYSLVLDCLATFSKAFIGKLLAARGVWVSDHRVGRPMMGGDQWPTK